MFSYKKENKCLSEILLFNCLYLIFDVGYLLLLIIFWKSFLEVMFIKIDVEFNCILIFFYILF